jgi:translation initiation factor IF-1
MSDEVKLEGTVLDQFSGGMYDVKFSDGVECRCKMSGRMDHHDIDVTVGDEVVVKFHNTDMNTGLIIERK